MRSIPNLPPLPQLEDGLHTQIRNRHLHCMRPGVQQWAPL